MIIAILSAIINSMEKIPEELRYVCSMVSQYVEQKFSGLTSIAVGGIFFLRLICPTITVPKSYRIIDSNNELIFNLLFDFNFFLNSNFLNFFFYFFLFFIPTIFLKKNYF